MSSCVTVRVKFIKLMLFPFGLEELFSKINVVLFELILLPFCLVMHSGDSLK